jgi:hypothetical protein
MHVDTDALNKMHFGFLEVEYGFAYTRDPYGNGTYSSPSINISLQAWGSTAPVLSVLDVDIWFRQEPACTWAKVQWIAECWGVSLHLRESPSYSSLLKYYQKQSAFFQKHVTEILFHHEEWLLPVMKFHFQQALDFVYRGDLQALLTTPSSSDLYRYLKSKDPNWEPSRGLRGLKSRNYRGRNLE